MNKRTLIIPFALSAACLFAGTVPAFAAGSFTVEDAKNVAASYLPSGCTFLRSETDSREYELKYYNESSGELYDLDVSRTTQKVTKLESQKIGSRGSDEVSLSTENVEKLVKDQYPSASGISVSLDRDDGYYIYEASLTDGDSRVELKLHPTTGEILEKDIDYSYITPASVSRIYSGSIISYEKAQTLALDHVSGAMVTDIDLDQESGTLVYEIELYKDGVEYDLILNAWTGEKLHLSSHQDIWDDDDSFHWNHHGIAEGSAHHSSHHSSASAASISLAEAKELLLAKVPSAQIKELELDTEDGRLVYEGELRNGNMEYEFQLDASTGVFIEWEQEYDD